jgi:hypothetical protein
MKKFLIVSAIIALVILLPIIIIVFVTVSKLNSETVLANQVKAQQVVNQTVFDNTWKIIQEQAGVADKYKDAFAEIYPKLMDARYDKGGDLMKWVQESNPNFDIKLYDKLMSSIELQRTKFTEAQKQLIDFNREHDVMLESIPWGIIMKALGRQKIEIKIVTSTRTEKAFETGKDDKLNI